jgi:dTDP-glucose 4,6-dehydratase
MSQVLVMGSNGFSGASFSAWLMDQGFDVLGVSRSEEPHEVMLPYRWGSKLGRFRF